MIVLQDIKAPMLVCRIPGSDLAIDFTQAEETYIGKMLRKSGIAGYEPDSMAAAAALIEAYDITSFTDIGANIGIYSLVLRAIFGDRLAVDAFEPLKLDPGWEIGLKESSGAPTGVPLTIPWRVFAPL